MSLNYQSYIWIWNEKMASSVGNIETGGGKTDMVPHWKVYYYISGRTFLMLKNIICFCD